MAEILDAGTHWKLVINPGANFVQNIDEPDKGYKAKLGFSDELGKHVVMEVLYEKSKYPINEVIKKVDQLKSCNKCSTLDKENLNLEKVQIGAGTSPDVAGTDRLTAGPSAAPGPAYAAKTRTTVKDVFANAFFDTYLTEPGRYFLGMLLGDDALIDSVAPKTEAENARFMDQMVSFFSGETDFFRTPEQAKEYLAVMRGDQEDAAETRFGAKTVKTKRKRSLPPTATIIY